MGSVNMYDPTTGQLRRIVGDDNHLRDEMVAEYEPNSTASHAYSKGDQLIYNETLYSATKNIAIGDELSTEETSAWKSKTWNGYASPVGSSIWTDGENIYFSGGTVSKQYVLDKATSTWNTKTWNGLSSPSGGLIWTDGEDIYFSGYVNSRLNAQYVLDKSTSTWNEKIWNGFNELKGYNIWTDGNNIYYSDPEGGPNEYQFVLDKSTSTWNEINWNYSGIYGSQIWSDGEHIYCSYNARQFAFNKNDLTWSDLPSSLIIECGEAVWNDGVNTYYSWGAQQLVLDKSTSTWKTKEWSGLTNFSASAIWNDGDNTYCSDGSDQYILRKSNIVPSLSITEQLANAGSGGGGHTILDEDGTTYPQRSKLQFEGAIVSDDSTNGITKIKAEGGVTGVKGNAESTYRTGDVNMTPADIGLGNVNNTADADKPVSTATQNALNGKVSTDGASTNTIVVFTSNDLAANTTAKTSNTTNQPSTVAKLGSGETLASMFGKLSSMFASIRKLWNTVGFETAQISKVVGDTSVTFTNSAIKTTSELTLLSENSSNTPIFYTAVTVSAGSATYTFPALTVATKFSLKVR